MRQALHVWLQQNQGQVNVGAPVDVPQWAKRFISEANAQNPSEFVTSGGHNGRIAFFDKGLVYSRDGLKSPVVMLYDSAEFGGDTSARFRVLLLDHFTDANGLVLVNYDFAEYKAEHPAEVGESTQPVPAVPIADNTGIDTNDSAWMTGQALASMAFFGDLTSAAFILQGMLNHEWSGTGNLLRYTGNTKPFAGPDPSTQITGCYFAWQKAAELGNAQVQNLARAVIVKWIEMLFRCNGKIGPEGSVVVLPGLIAIYEVAKAIGVKQEVLDKLTLLINEQKIGVALLSFGTLSAAALLDDSSLYALCVAIAAGLQNAALSLPEWLRIKVDLQSEGDAPIDLSGLNLTFWQLLAMHECLPNAVQNVVALNLAEITKPFGMMPLQWLGARNEGVEACRPFVADWSAANGDTAETKPSEGNYLWRTEKRNGPGSEVYNKVDYLALRGLFNLDRSKWENAPHHIGVSCDLPIPQLGTIRIAGSIESDGDFELSGEATLSPFGYELQQAKLLFNNQGLRVSGALKLPGLANVALSGEVLADASFSLSGSFASDIKIAQILIISSSTGNGGAKITLSSTGNPILELDAGVTFLGLKQSVKASVEHGGFGFTLEDALPLAKFKLKCFTTLEAVPRYECEGELTFGIDETVGPIQLAPGTPSLGKVKVKANVSSGLKVKATPDQFDATANAHFDFQGIDIEVPEIKLQVAPDSLDGIAKAIIKYVVDHPTELLGELFEDADRWLNALKDKILTEVENVAQVLKSHFNKGNEFIANAIQNTLGEGPAAAAKALKSLGETAGSIAGTLKGLGGVADDIGDALSKADFPDTEISDALSDTFGEPVPWPPHVKHIKVIDHVKHIKVIDHVKHIKVIDHVKHIKVVPDHVKHIKVIDHVKHIKLF